MSRPMAMSEFERVRFLAARITEALSGNWALLLLTTVTGVLAEAFDNL